jgi:hypothetical protein
MFHSAELMRSLEISQANAGSDALAQVNQLLHEHRAFSAKNATAYALKTAQLIGSFAELSRCEKMMHGSPGAARVYSTCVASRHKNVLALSQTQWLRANSAVSAHFTYHLLLHCSFEIAVVRLAAVSPSARKELAELRMTIPKFSCVTKTVLVGSFPKLTVVPLHHETPATTYGPTLRQVGLEIDQ